MSAFKDDHAENMNNPEYAYEFGRTERELEIVKLLEANNRCANELGHAYVADCYCEAIALIKGEE